MLSAQRRSAPRAHIAYDARQRSSVSACAQRAHLVVQHAVGNSKPRLCSIPVARRLHKSQPEAKQEHQFRKKHKKPFNKKVFIQRLPIIHRLSSPLFCFNSAPFASAMRFRRGFFKTYSALDNVRHCSLCLAFAHFPMFSGTSTMFATAFRILPVTFNS